MKPSITYKALVADKQKESGTEISVQTLSTDDLPDHDVLIRVDYSSLNYKDALSASGNSGVTRSYPHTPGIDAAGVVEYSRNQRFKNGDKVIVTGYDLGQNTAGGFGRYISVPGDWIVALLKGLSLKESMIFGTAGFTAAYGVQKIVAQNSEPEELKIVVTGATGGVGSFAVALLAHLGYTVIAVTGKEAQHSYLRKIGASEILNRRDLTGVSSKPLLTSRWAGAIDTVGGTMLDCVLRQISHNGIVACCGNILGGELHTSVYPFILRGITLAGIDSGNCLMKDRLQIWDKLSGRWKPKVLNKLSREIKLEQLPQEINKILEGRQKGRILVNLRDDPA